MAWNEYRGLLSHGVPGGSHSQTQTTNVALGRSSDGVAPLWAGHSPAVLTDGLPGSFNHPEQSGLGSAFSSKSISVPFVSSITSPCAVAPMASPRIASPACSCSSTISRPAHRRQAGVAGLASGGWFIPGCRRSGCHPRSDGEGTCRGRYIRISSDSPVALSPQLAEVEAYEALTPRPVSFKADRHTLSLGNPMNVPAGSDVLTVRFEIPGGLPERLPIRWRLRGLHDDWQITRDSIAEVSASSPGRLPA